MSLDPYHTYRMRWNFEMDIPGIGLGPTDISSQFTFDLAETGSPVDFQDIEVSPESYDFGKVLIGTFPLKTTTISVSNTGTRDLYIDTIRFSPDGSSDFLVTSPLSLTSTVPAGGTVDIEVAFSPLSLGASNAILEIHSDDADNPLVTVVLCGVGVTPEIEVSPTSYDYGEVMIGSSATTVVRISNTGTGDLIIMGICFLGSSVSDYSITSSTPEIIPSSECADVEIKFAPSSLGYSDKVLWILSLDLDEADVYVDFSGIGVANQSPIVDSVDDYVSISVGRVAYDRRTGQFSVDVKVTNDSQTVIGNPVWLVIESISNPSVTLAGAYGTTIDGKPYVDLSGLLGNGQLDPGETISKRIYFNNPNRVQFTFDKSIRGVISP